MKATDERVTFADIDIGDCFAIGRGRNQKLYLKTADNRYGNALGELAERVMENRERPVYRVSNEADQG